jgi:hypothetical protein
MEMDGLPPTPETSASLYVWFFMLLAAVTSVLCLLVVRRRNGALRALALGLWTLVLLGLGGVFLTVPPRVLPDDEPGTWQRCPYDRITWSNMRADIDREWQPCRRAARVELGLMLATAAAVSVVSASALLHRREPAPAAAAEETPARQLELTRRG